MATEEEAQAAFEKMLQEWMHRPEVAAITLDEEDCFICVYLVDEKPDDLPTSVDGVPITTKVRGGFKDWW